MANNIEKKSPPEGDKAPPPTQEEVLYANRLQSHEWETMAEELCGVALDGCKVDIDGFCPHGYLSPFLVVGIF